MVGFGIALIKIQRVISQALTWNDFFFTDYFIFLTDYLILDYFKKVVTMVTFASFLQ